MSRLRTFLIYQRLSLRSLFRWHRKGRVSPEELAASDAAEISHPSQLCRCFDRPANAVHDVLADHAPGCQWVAAMCDRCAGTGWCVRCGGEGTAPDWDPEKTPTERPSSRRLT